MEKIEQIFQKLIEEKKFFIPGQVVREFAEHRITKLRDLHQQILKNKDVSFSIGNYPLLESMDEYKKIREIEAEISEKLKDYRKQLNELMDQVSNWYWNDPVSNLYSKLFDASVIHELDLAKSKESVEKRVTFNIEYKTPPGYKDGSKPDDGVGDVLIWYSIIDIARANKTNMIFVSSDRKPDWWIKSGNQHLYPRYELIDEYRRESDGNTLHIISFSDFLNLFGVDEKFVDEIRQEEDINRMADIVSPSISDLLEVVIQIERDVRYLIANLGLLSSSRGIFNQDIRLLTQYGFNRIADVENVWRIRNHVVHGFNSDIESIKIAIKLALEILEDLKLIHYQSHTVKHVEIEIYDDENCKIINNNVKGVIIENRHFPGDIFVGTQIFPAKSISFVVGTEVSWEWGNQTFGEAWYRDPSTNEIKSAWAASVEFTGRNLDLLNVRNL